MDELTNRVVALEDVLGRGAPELVERLYEAPGLAGSVRAARRRAAAARAGRAGARAGGGVELPRLAAADGRVAAGALADEVGWSRRHLAARWRRDVGMGPKAVARVLRFQRALRLLREGRALADVAYDCGYADQPHLNREFRALGGSTPGEVTNVQDPAPRAGLAWAACPAPSALLTATPAAAIDFGSERLRLRGDRAPRQPRRHDRPRRAVARRRRDHARQRRRRPRGPPPDDPARGPLVDLHRRPTSRRTRARPRGRHRRSTSHDPRAHDRPTTAQPRVTPRATPAARTGPSGPPTRASGGRGEPGLGVDRAGVAQALEHRRDRAAGGIAGGDRRRRGGRAGGP